MSDEEKKDTQLVGPELTAVPRRRTGHHVPVEQRAAALDRIDEQFDIGKSVRHLHALMHKVTEKEVTADSVTAACSCVREINASIKTTLMAARYLSGR